MQNKHTLLITAILLFAAFGFGQTYVSGDVSGIWEASGNPYYVTDNVNVPSGEELRIKAGCEIIFLGWFGIFVDSLASFKAIGTEEDTILFTAEDTVLTRTTGGHLGVSLNNASPSCSLLYCEMEYGRGGRDEYWNIHKRGTLLAAYCSSLVVANCKFSRCKLYTHGLPDESGRGAAVSIAVSDSLILKDCVVYDNYSDDSGGGIAISDCEDLNVSDNYFCSNIALRTGGGQ